MVTVQPTPAPTELSAPDNEDPQEQSEGVDGDDDDEEQGEEEQEAEVEDEIDNGDEDEDEDEENDEIITLTSTRFVKPSASAKKVPAKASDEDAELLEARETAAPKRSNLPIDIPWCVTVADVAWDGQYLPVDAHPAGPDGKCSSPPTYSGLPYGSPQTPTLRSSTRSKKRTNATPPAAQTSSSKPAQSSVAAPLPSEPTAPASSTTNVGVSSSAATPDPVSSAPAISSSAAAEPSPSASSSKHPYCVRKSKRSLLIGGTGAPRLTTSVILSKTSNLKPSDASSPDLQAVSSMAVAKEEVGEEHIIVQQDGKDDEAKRIEGVEGDKEGWIKGKTRGWFGLW